jgi:hypothetical protein
MDKKQSTRKGRPFYAPDPYRNIRSYAQTYASSLRKMEQGIGTPDPEEETAVVIIERQYLEDILAVEAYDVAAVFGVEGGRLTISFLALDSNGDVSPRHIEGEADGQEVWPNKITVSHLEEFLPEPTKRKRK